MRQGGNPMKLKIMTYNICSGHHFIEEAGYVPGTTSPYDLKQCIQVIQGVTPDILGLNEVDNHAERTFGDCQTQLISDATGMNGFFGKALNFPVGDYGNAVLSRFPIVKTDVFPIPDPQIRDECAYYESRSVTRVKLDVMGQEVTVLQTHFGLAIAEQQNAQQTLLALLDQETGPVIVMGDFNIRPNNFLLNPLRERLIDTAVLRSDYFKTFPSYPTDYPDCKIDYVFVSKHFTPLHLEVIQTRASDHMPYMVELELHTDP